MQGRVARGVQGDSEERREDVVQHLREGRNVTILPGDGGDNWKEVICDHFMAILWAFMSVMESKIDYKDMTSVQLSEVSSTKFQYPI